MLVSIALIVLAQTNPTPPSGEDHKQKIDRFNARLDELEGKIATTGSRVNLIRDAVLGEKIARSRAVIFHRNEMGSSFVLERATYLLDGGVIFAIGVLQMYRMWSAQMHFEDSDRAWMKAMQHYVRNQDEKMPPAGRYNAGQKMLFWGFQICTLLMLVTGVMMWFPEYMPRNLILLLRLAIFVHASAAMLTVGLFLIHIYMGVFAERGAFGSVIRGDVSLKFAERYHPGWYKEITGRPTSPQK